MTHNFKQFQNELNKKLKDIQKEQQSKAKGILIYAYDELTNISPVHLGLYKTSHIFSVNKRDSSKSDKVDKSRISSNKNKINNTTLKIGNTLYAQNNLDYAQSLEDGHSKQAPLGIYSIAEERTKDKIEKVKL